MGSDYSIKEVVYPADLTMCYGTWSTDGGTDTVKLNLRRHARMQQVLHCAVQYLGDTPLDSEPSVKTLPIDGSELEIIVQANSSGLFAAIGL